MSDAAIEVTMVEAHADQMQVERLLVPAGACMRDALSICGLARGRELLTQMQSVDHVADSFVGIWGRRALLNTPLNDGDRIELYRELVADAKSARLKRASEQGYRWQGRTRRAAKTENT